MTMLTPPVADPDPASQGIAFSRWGQTGGNRSDLEHRCCGSATGESRRHRPDLADTSAPVCGVGDRGYYTFLKRFRAMTTRRASLKNPGRPLRERQWRMRNMLYASFAAILLLVSPSCAGQGDNKKSSNGVAENPSKADENLNKDGAIGTATMTEAGAIVLSLRAKAADRSIIGDARLVYPKNDKQYSEILKHLARIMQHRLADVV
jgi:hypothetical protein